MTRRWTLTRWILVLSALAVALGLVSLLLAGPPWQPRMSVTGDSERDCRALADRDGFAHEVCAPLRAGWREPATLGPAWEPVNARLARALREDDPTRDWRACLVRWGDTTYVVCPDGYVQSS